MKIQVLNVVEHTVSCLDRIINSRDTYSLQSTGLFVKSSKLMFMIKNRSITELIR